MIVSTFPNESTAKEIINQLLEEKLIACANILPEIKSFNRWKETIEESLEVIVFFKTKKVLELTVLETIKFHHPYEVPAIYIVESMEKINSSYLQWIEDVTTTKK